MWSDSSKEITKFPLDFYKMSFWTIFRLIFHKKVIILCHQIIKRTVNTNYVNSNYEALLSFSLCKVAYRNTVYLLKRLSLRINLISVQNECIMKHLLLMP